MADSQRKTANLFDVSTQTVGAFVRAGNITAEKPLGNIEAAAGYNLSAYIAVIPNTIYTIKYPVTSVVGGAGLVYYSDNNGTTISGIPLGDQGQTYTFTTPNNCNYIRFSYDNTQGIDVMLNSGSQPLPYEPYWQHSLRKLTTATDTLTTLPSDLYADGNNATVGLVGNMSQTGTPTPQNPIQPSECGERTGNLFDYQQTTGITDNCYINQSGTVVSSNDYYLSYPIEVDTNSDYTWKFNDPSSGGIIKPTHTAPSVGFYDENNNLLSAATHDSYIRYFTFTTPNNCAYIRVSVYKLYKNEAVLNMGTTPIAYQPYGYKLDIKSANTTTPVYLGEVESTRRVQKIIFTGSDSEGWTSQTLQRKLVSFPKPSGLPAGTARIISSHFVTVQTNNPTIGELYVGGSWINFNYDNVNDLDTWKAYLAQQYAAGTPVCVWYVLATPQTAVVNEPIRKIGDYADTVSDITIPTIAGKDTFDVLTTLKPSEVSLNYTGWHDASAKEWNGSQWQ